MARFENFGLSSDDKKSEKDKSKPGSTRDTRTVRVSLGGLDNKATRNHHELPQTRPSLLTGAIEYKTDRKEDAKPKKPTVEAPDIKHTGTREQTTDVQSVVTPEATQVTGDSEKKPVAKADEYKDDRDKDRAEDSAYYAGWASGPDTEVRIQLDKENVSGDIYVARAVGDKEWSDEEAKAHGPAEESRTEPADISLEMATTEAEKHENPAPAIGWHELQMIQHQARDYEASPADTESPTPLPGGEHSAGNGGGVPPRGPEEMAFGQPPEPEENQQSFIPLAAAAEQLHQSEPAEIFREHARRDAEASRTYAVTSTEQMVTRKEADERAYYAEKTGQNRGLVTGLIAGGAYEHFKHKRREKKVAKAHQEQVRKLQEVQEDQLWATKEQIQKQAEATRQLQGAEARLAAAEKRPQFQPLPPAEAARLAEKQTNEQLHQQGVPEMQQTQAAERLVIPPEYRVESSAWHNIVVDTRTGRPVETPTFTYGHEYYRERAHESTPLQQRNAAAGEIVLTAATGAAGGIGGGGVTGDAQSDDSAAPPSANIPSATMQGPPSSVRQAQTQPFSAPAPKTSRPVTPLWPYLVTLAAILLCLVVLLR